MTCVITSFTWSHINEGSSASLIHCIITTLCDSSLVDIAHLWKPILARSCASLVKPILARVYTLVWSLSPGDYCIGIVLDILNLYRRSCWVFFPMRVSQDKPCVSCLCVYLCVLMLHCVIAYVKEHHGSNA